MVIYEQKRKQQEKRINTREKQFQLNLVKWSKKNANCSSHLRKINEKVRQKLGRHTYHSLTQLPAKLSLL